MNLEDEARNITEMLKNKIVDVVYRHSECEICVQFNDGTRLFVDATKGGLEISITGP